MLLLILQRYEFSSKSQPLTKFKLLLSVVADTTKVRIFKQITTRLILLLPCQLLLLILQRYEFSSKSQQAQPLMLLVLVVADTTKVRIFKQITTKFSLKYDAPWLLLILQRYEFSSKSQRKFLLLSG